ncbi:hypothetical protein [Nesterenkonia flava]|uniref:Uncharacterized protein n=1 Tax=Nesterenkonia flava TaxID=469799 RepID=A0ABU1FT33_9MICC|nr:hypothetical protein [Nesterenkonia flava]MDR5711823.1 hypothetical protein [Nesterenkonia flava]
MAQKAPTTARRGFRMPHIYVILFALSALEALATYVVPAHQFERVEGPDGRQVIDLDTYTAVEASPTSFLDFMTAIPRGLVDAGEVVFFTFIIYYRRRFHGDTTAGFTAGVLNPINTGLAQQISGVETFSGAGLRAVLLVVLIG